MFIKWTMMVQMFGVGLVHQVLNWQSARVVFKDQLFFLKLVAQIPGIRKRPKPIVISRKCAKNDFRPITKILWHTRSFHNMYSTQTAFNLFSSDVFACETFYLVIWAFFGNWLLRFWASKKSIHFFFLSRKSLGCGNSSLNWMGYFG